MKLPAGSVMIVALLLSASVHALSLGVFSQFPSNLDREKATEIYEIVLLKKEKPPLLPEIDIMGEEKKIPLQNLIKMAEKTKPELVAEEITTSKDKLLNKVKVLNPTKEAMLRYHDIVKQRIEAVRRYPPWAEKRGIEGRAHIVFAINTDGNCRKVELVRSSNSSLLDKEAIAAIKRANPFPPLPEGIGSPCVQMDVEIVFSLR